MAKVTRSKTTKKRQPAKNQLPSSRAKKPSVKTAKKKPVASKKTASKRAKPADKTSKKPAATKSPARKNQARTRKINIRLGRRTSLVLSFKLAKKSPPKKRKKSQKKKRELTIDKSLLLSVALVFTGVFGINQSSEHIFGAPLDPNSAYSTALDFADDGEAGKYLPKSDPVRLRAPAIKLDTALSAIGKNPDGTMEVPKDHHVAGWYSFGPTPGEKGPAVITGHVNSYLGPSVFANLSKLKKGQTIEVKRADGTTAKFKVNGVKQFSQKAFPTEQVYGNIEHAGLRLITCGGNFNYLTRQYSDNTVVFASYIQT